ncbi:Rpp14/Pop5 family protein [Halanaeroarchaeum sulfurireducens]|uniref:Ribonuclease P protein component 2 n=1 Tax=Halanaeroarchaeum sulfurireducens TaxID=1604004 RepID=A0A0F7PBK8_9EURY|nr:Rpp14/Pop5 family protein [Halanaeroarchaeum sulfurireducens]AKH98077.1 ribonuclease P protein subunit RPP14 [Halanaeroarchaeum sulfurireducens]ALG82471.1 ribonuclease P protein subunit RPP14 [Halanaeroarchaeum sulfurireducens]
MKHLPKHLRQRWRYLAVELETWPDASISEVEFQRSLWFAAQNLIGDVGSAEAELRVVSFAFGDGAGSALVRTRRGAESLARAAIACVDSVYDEPIRVTVGGISGTVRAAEEKYLGGPAEATEQESVAFRNESRRAVARNGRLDVEIDGTFVGATRLDTT